ncbi:MAG: hypothetical protein ACP5I7_04925, partial [Sulfolobales archaeon]
MEAKGHDLVVEGFIFGLVILTPVSSDLRANSLSFSRKISLQLASPRQSISSDRYDCYSYVSQQINSV